MKVAARASVHDVMAVQLSEMGILPDVMAVRVAAKALRVNEMVLPVGETAPEAGGIRSDGLVRDRQWRVKEDCELKL